MDEKALGILGAAAAVAVAGRRLRPVAKLMMKGYVAVEGAAGQARRDIGDLYAEARAERQPATPSAPADPATNRSKAK
jgi:hypothetical protein